MSPLNETQKTTLPLIALCAVATPFVGPVAILGGLGMTAYYCAKSNNNQSNDSTHTKN